MKIRQLPEIIGGLKRKSKRALAALVAVATLTTGAALFTSCDSKDKVEDSTETKGELTELREITDEELEELYNKVHQKYDRVNRISLMYISEDVNEYDLHTVLITDPGSGYSAIIYIPESTYQLIKELEEYGRFTTSPSTNLEGQYLFFRLLVRKEIDLPDDVYRKLLFVISYHIDDKIDD